MIGNRAHGHDHYFVVHGHFYQPPRENPWLDIIEQQPSAAPAHDWNERVFDECYRPSAHSRLLDRNGMIYGIHNNYRAMSFNFGPTLFSWFEKKHPRLIEQIVLADKESAARLNGHGNAVAQVYNHIIMPLAPVRDQLTQIRWGVSHFRRSFSRDPEGIWLAETAINRQTARLLIDEGIRFTILSPTQAEAFRPLDYSHDWINAAARPLEVRRSYRYFPDENRRNEYLDIFFFDEMLSKEISFGNLLTSSETLASRLHACFTHNAPEPQAVVVATDGETFGHHKAYGDMCLAFLYEHEGPPQGLVPVNFGYLLEKYPPRFEVRLKNADGEGTAWSCSHGMGRWKRDCGCNTGGKPKWNQAWRTPLRAALEYLRQEIDTSFEKQCAGLIADPWKARDAYEPLMRIPSWERTRDAFIACGASTTMTRPQIMAVRRLLEAQKYMLFSFTSCGWFFADISGIETQQNLAYACRALHLGIEPERRREVEQKFIAILQSASSNLPAQTGKTLYENNIVKYSRHLEILGFTVVAQQIIMDRNERRVNGWGYQIQLELMMRQRSGTMQFNWFRVKIENDLTGESDRLLILLSHYRGRNVIGWVVPSDDAIRSTFNAHDLNSWYMHPRVVKLDLSSIFENSKVALADFMMQQIAINTTARYTSWLSTHEQALESLVSLRNALPPPLAGPVGFVLNAQWNQVMGRIDRPGQEDRIISSLLDIWHRAERFSITIDFSHSAMLLQRSLVSRLSSLAEQVSIDTCNRIRYLLNIVDRFKIPMEKHKLEDLFHPIYNGAIKSLYEKYKADPGIDYEQKSTLLHLLSFARRMNFNTDAFPVAEKN
jgi:hypothetical protein